MQQTVDVTEPRDRLIVALDVPSAEDAGHLIACLGSSVSFYKIGLELICAGGGLALAERLVESGRRVFLDLKLHDIPNTVERATSRIAKIGVTFLTVHAYPQTMRAALAGAAGTGMKLLGVTVLTSADDNDLAEAGYHISASALTAHRAAQAEEMRLFGLVCSAVEVATLRAQGRRLALVCPGIRPTGSDVDDQKRSATPSVAIRKGADYLVVGRPISRSSEPRAAAEGIISEIAASLDASYV